MDGKIFRRIFVLRIAMVFGRMRSDNTGLKLYNRLYVVT